ncbi:synaptotagmin-9 isoform X2 [Microplitis demolitor]|uniref:synaptotagmin-9 isoform X2 n=1 Tax=Microplitis demolitor TaxID=69319 RepID=UPI00235B5F38|nr:synaptotagmin-9 isoform X2 [Microplitis demolitor]
MFLEELVRPLSHMILLLIGIGTILLVLVLIVCFSVPKCFGYECLKAKRNQKNKTVAEWQADHPNGHIKLGDISYRSWRLGSLYDNGSICKNGESFKDWSQSDCLDFDSQKKSSSVSLVDQGNLTNMKKIQEFPTELTLILQFLPTIDEPKSTKGKLVISIEALSNIPPKQYNCAIKPYVVVKIVKQLWTPKNQNVLHSFRTRSIRHTVNPVYSETFVIEDVNVCSTKDWILSISVFDNDRYANHTELSTIQIPFKDLRKIFTNPEMNLFNYKMKQSNQEFGNILLGVTYLPTAQRLSITIMKIRNLKCLTGTSLPTELNLYVRVLMLYGKTGRKIRKKKTRMLGPAMGVELNETLTFELSCNQLDTVQFLLILCSKII